MAHLPYINIGIKHGFPCINVCQVPREMLKTEAEGRGFQQLLRDLANVNALENNVWSLLLHEINHNAEKNNKISRALFSTSLQLPCWFLHALSISIKILVPGHGRLSSLFQPLAIFHKFKSFSLTFSFNVACSVFFFPQYSNLHNSYQTVLSIASTANVMLLLYCWSIALNLAYEKSNTYALMAREIPC